MSSPAKVVLVATLVSVGIGFVTVCLVVLADESSANIRHSVTSADGLLNLAVIGAVVSLPISVPVGLIGGVLAARAASRARSGRSLGNWVGHGSLWGVGMGAAGSVLFFAVLNVGSETSFLMLFVTGAIGASAGATVGAIVGAYCGCTVGVPEG